MLLRLNNPLLPLIIIVLVLGLYITRWEKEVSYKPSGSIQFVYKTDRWTGQRWVINYMGSNVMELPIIDDYVLNTYIESIKNRPDVIKLQEDKIKEVHLKMKNFKEELSTYIDLSTREKRQFIPITKEDESKFQLNRVEKEIYQLAVDTAKIDLGNKAWVKRKYYSWAWDGFFVLSSLWLLVSILMKKKKPGTE